MEASFCKACNKRHNGPCNVFYNTAVPVRQLGSNKVKKVWVKPELGVYVRQGSLTERIGFDKRAYQREYMRKRRVEMRS